MTEQTLDINCIRYLNLFEKITGVRTNRCFFYNRALVFAIPEYKMPNAIGEQGHNIRKLSTILGKRIKVVPMPRGIGEAGKFITHIISPISIKNIEIHPEEIVVNAGQNKATLFGRDKVRYLELKKIIEESFGKGLRIA